MINIIGYEKKNKKGTKWIQNHVTSKIVKKDQIYSFK